MHASFPPFTKQPERTAASLPITDRESDLRTLKHYLYHASLLVGKLLAEDVPAEFAPFRFVEDDREGMLPLRRNPDGSLATDGTAAEFTRDRDATGA